jgi:4-hydroxy-3-methylbut-2-enyl diphosphate reductase
VQTVEHALEHYGAPIYVRHQIVHNLHVVRSLEAKGAIFVDENDEVPDGATVIFSAHGVSPAVHAQAEARQLKVIDATCPLVTKVHHEVRRYAQEGYQILLIGHAGHEEVVGTSGEAPGQITLVESPEAAETVQVRDPDRVVWLSQTTLSVDETMETVEVLRRRFPNLASPPSDDICYATQNRQSTVKAIAPEVELFLVVGSSNSSNSQRMVEVALASGAPTAYLVENRDAIDEVWLSGVSTVGLSSGASVPEILVREVVEWLAEHDFADLREVNQIDERLTFALPQELRRDLRTVPAH